MNLTLGPIRLGEALAEGFTHLYINLTTSEDSFDKLNCFPGVANEYIGAKRYFPQTESVSRDKSPKHPLEKTCQGF
jgi:hypothetical protein